MAKISKNKIDSIRQSKAAVSSKNVTPLTYNDFIVSTGDIVASARGRTFGSWIDKYSRSNGYNEGDFIKNPVYIVESLYRDEILSEINLIASDVTSDSLYYYITFNNSEGYLRNTGTYVGASLHLMTAKETYPEGWVADIIAYYKSTKTIIISKTADLSIVIGDSFKITNINPDMLDVTSFDLLGNTTNGALRLLEARQSITQKQSAGEILKPLLYEFSLRLILSQNGKIKLVRALEEKTTVDGTLNLPIKYNSEPLITVDYTDQELLYTNFTFNHNYIYSKEEYREKFTINEYGYKERTNVIISYGDFSDEVALINNLVKNLNINREYIYDCKWITNTDSFVSFAKKVIKLTTKQRALITYVGDYQHHLQYEPGDVVKIDYPKVMPASLNNSTQFQIQSVNIDMSKNRIITFTLLEI